MTNRYTDWRDEFQSRCKSLDQARELITALTLKLSPAQIERLNAASA